ncbi:hypothetical protein M413DRAFT_437935 [Hebeloma cylindrosporum]|uniref:Vacuolar calcium ion transporter n=1 Tax=Hebeloma cylindrosporum TaxID=76867 RepID=A0A0C2YGA7_HEBCY|nr:hypothetical protein M413DRAFT_437935 [Hebeloma cylindrosporum h7]
MPQDPERTPLIPNRISSFRGQGRNGESGQSVRAPGGVGRIVGFVRGDGEPSWVQSFSWLLFGSYFNVFLAFVPLSIVAQQTNWDVLHRFGFSFFAIIPLAKLLGEASNQTAVQMGNTLAGFMNITSGSVINIIIGLAALLQDEVRIVQTAMLGSILSELVLVMGISFLVDALKRPEGLFHGNGTQHLSSLMTLGCFILAMPAAYDVAMKSSEGPSRYSVISKGASIVLLLVYCSYLYFQLVTVNSIYGNFGAPTPGETTEDERIRIEEERVRNQHMNGLSAVFALVLIIPVTWFCVNDLISSIDEFSSHYNVSKLFIGLILLPIITNAAENVPSIYMALTYPLETAVPICVGGTMQIAALVIPLLVVIGWILGHELSLIFSHFETIVLIVSVLLVNTLVQDGKSNYMEGLMLVSLYFVIGLTFWVSK